MHWISVRFYEMGDLYIVALSKLQESAEIAAVWYTNLNGIVVSSQENYVQKKVLFPFL